MYNVTRVYQKTFFGLLVKVEADYYDKRLKESQTQMDILYTVRCQGELYKTWQSVGYIIIKILQVSLSSFDYYFFPLTFCL